MLWRIELARLYTLHFTFLSTFLFLFFGEYIVTLVHTILYVHFKIVDVTIISSFVKRDNVQIHMFFIEETTYFNVGTFNEDAQCHVLS